MRWSVEWHEQQRLTAGTGLKMVRQIGGRNRNPRAETELADKSIENEGEGDRGEGQRTENDGHRRGTSMRG